MRKRLIKKLAIVGLLAIAMCFTTSCKENETTDNVTEKKEEVVQKDATGTVYVLNDFESNKDLYSIKPSVANNNATMVIVGKDEGQVKTGNASLKYEYKGGTSPDMLLFIKQSDKEDLDIANLNKVNVSVFTQKKVKATLSVVTEKKARLLAESYELKANEWNDLEFRLSYLACKFNAENIVGFMLQMETNDPFTFYVDNWNVTMGAENTEEDNKWEPVLNKIVERINEIPEEVTVSDGESLEELYMDYAKLPELYRNIVPNYSILYEKISLYAQAKYAAEEDALERKFLAFDEFYGIGQISGDYPMLYQTEVKHEGDKGAIEITFDGSTQESYFPFETPLDSDRYDTLKISFYNADVYRKVIYFNWNQRLVIEPETWGTMKIKGSELTSPGNLIVDTIDEAGTRINSSGKVYVGAMHATRRDLLAELKKLPNASDLEIPRDIKYLTLVEKTMELYNDTVETEKADIPNDLVENLKACYKKVEGYGTAFDVNTEEIAFGTPDCKAVGNSKKATDSEYGPVYEMNFTAKAQGDYAAGFQFNKDMTEYTNMFYYVYNPKSSAQTMYFYANGSWTDLGERVLEPGWNKIDLPKDANITGFMFGLFPKTADVVGTWKVTSVYYVSDTIVDKEEAEEVIKMINTLPNASVVSMPKGMKYVAAISGAKNAYDALSSKAKAQISSGLKNKLDSCLAKIKGYSAVINPSLDEMRAGTPDCACKGSVSVINDKNYGLVYNLKITATDTKGDYAGGFQINKDISKSSNIFFYVYNPKKEVQIMYLYADNTWKDLGAVSLSPGWNKIELSNDKKIEKYVFGLFPKGSKITGTWKISSFYAIDNDVIDKQNASEIKSIIKKLPKPSKIKMPRDIKYLTDIYAANEAYNSLSKGGKKYVSVSDKKKLDACVKKVKGYEVVVNAKSDKMMVGTPDCSCLGELTRNNDKTYGSVFGLKITKVAIGDYAAGFQVDKDLSDKKNMFFYIYNPMKSAQTMYLYADPTWKNLGTIILNPGWNKVELSNSKNLQINQYFFGLFPKETDVVGTWKITSVYAKSDAVIDKEEASSVSKLIKGLPQASKISMPKDIKYLTDIYAANDSYKALSNNAKKKISIKYKNKLEACMKAVTGYSILVNAKTADMSVGTPDCHCYGTLSRLSDSTYGTVFGLNVSEIDKGDYAAGFQVDKDMTKSKNIYFYIYNPKASAQIMYLYADPTWKNLGTITLNPGWNKIELSNKQKVERYIFGLFPKGADVVGTWKISSFYAKSDTVIDKEEASSTIDMIKALPQAKNITMPKDTKYLADIYAANTSYNGLSTNAKKQVSTTLKNKLDEVLKAVDGYKVIVNAKNDELMVGTPDCQCNGLLKRLSDNTYGTVFGVEITAEAKKSDYAAGFQIEKDMSKEKNIYFYVYNPKESAQTMYLYADPSWKDMGTRTLNPGWNLIEISNSKKIERYIFGLFPKNSDIVGTWKVSSIYSKSDVAVDKEEAATTISLIKALPEATKISMPKDIKYLTDIYEAKDAYDGLSTSAKKQVNTELTNKLNACLKAISGYEVVVNAKSDDMTVGTPDVPCTGVLERLNDDTYGTVFGLNIKAIGTTANGAAGFQINKNLSGKKNIYFNIYNPLDKEQVMFLYANGSWTDLGAKTLQPGWNKIELPNDVTINQFVFGIFPANNDVVGTWKITSFYSVSDEKK